MTSIIDSIKNSLENYSPNWKEEKGVWIFSMTLSERKAFLSKRKLTYSGRIKVDEATHMISFFEMLVETGSGLAADAGFDSGMSTGFGFKSESFNTLSGVRLGNIEEQSILFGKVYSYRFDYAEIRARIRAIAENSGYGFEHQLLPVK